MTLIAIEELFSLANATNATCISIYSPMEQRGVETQQNPIRFKNLLRQAEEQLLASGLRGQDVTTLLEPAQTLDTYDFWQHQSDGFALFLSPEQFRYYCLPIAFPELAIVNDRFHLKPLLQLLSGDGQFYVLALSQNQVRLFRGTRYSVSEVELTDVPTSIAEALQYDDPEKSFQFHTGTAQVGSGSRAAVFHGHGAGNDDHKENLLRYFRKVNAGLSALLKNEQAPLVLAGVDYLLPIYQQANTYSHLLPEGVIGNPETLTAEDLHVQAWEIVQPYFKVAREETIAHYGELQGTGKTASAIEQVVPAAYFQRVDTLFVPVGEQVWGVFNPEANTIAIHPEPETGDEDLLDLAALHTLINGGTVYAVEPGNVPDDQSLAAVLRY